LDFQSRSIDTSHQRSAMISNDSPGELKKGVRFEIQSGSSRPHLSKLESIRM
jgi:hypothetical protein